MGRLIFTQQKAFGMRKYKQSPFEKLMDMHPELFVLASEYGYDVFPRSSDSIALGLFDQSNKKIFIYERTPCGKFRSVADLAFTLVHELMHLSHVININGEFDKFQFYYSPDFKVPKGSEQYYMERAHEVELDCDKVAKEWMDKFYKGGDKGKMYYRTYPVWRVCDKFVTEDVKMLKNSLIYNSIMKKYNRMFKKYKKEFAKYFKKS